MSGEYGYHNRKGRICSQIHSLLISLSKEPLEYAQIAPKIEYWIEYVLREDFTTVNELVEGVSYVAWDTRGGSFASVGKFFKEFRDAPHRSEQARTFVTQMCSHILRWFSIASVEGVWNTQGWGSGWVASGGGPGFIRAASFVGYLIEWGLLSHDLVRRHLTKSLTNHHDNDHSGTSPGYIRASAMYQLFTAAGNTLLQGLLEPDDIQACFDMLDTWAQRRMPFDAEKRKVRYTVHHGASLGV